MSRSLNEQLRRSQVGYSPEFDVQSEIELTSLEADRETLITQSAVQAQSARNPQGLFLFDDPRNILICFFQVVNYKIRIH